jgi:hypothetical protein
MSTDYQLGVAIQQLAGTYQKDNLNAILCEVVSVDTSKRTCVVATVNSDMEIKDVHLMAGINDGMLLIPTVGSQVVIIYSKMTTPYIALYSQLDKVICIVGDSGIEVTSDSIKLNDGSLGGLIKIEDLVSKINTIEQDINTLKTVFSGWAPVANDGGAALKAAAATWFAQQLTTTTKSDLENTNITHGSSL